MKIKRHFYAGFIALLPIVMTVYILNFLFNFFLKFISTSFIAIFLRAMLSKVMNVSGKSGMFLYNSLINVVTIFLIFFMICLVGYTLKYLFFIKLAKKMEKVLIKMPLVKHVYTSISQIVGIASKGKESSYQKVVAVQYPRVGIYSVGFLTSENVGIIQEMIPNTEHLCNVFIPTAPNPTSGFFILVQTKDIVILNIKVDDAIKMVLSGGGIVPEKSIQEAKGENENVKD